MSNRPSLSLSTATGSSVYQILELVKPLQKSCWWPVLISGFVAIGVLGRRLVLTTTVLANHTHLASYTRAVSLPG
jgi:hypothetical protein